MLCRKYMQKVFTLIEIVIVLVVIAFLLASTLPGFLACAYMLVCMQERKLCAIKSSCDRIRSAA